MAAVFDLKLRQSRAAGVRGNAHTQRTYRERRIAAASLHKYEQKPHPTAAPKRWHGLRRALDDLDRALRGELKLEEGEA